MIYRFKLQRAAAGVNSKSYNSLFYGARTYKKYNKKKLLKKCVIEK